MPALQVATYNIHRCIGRDGRFDPERIAGVLCEIGADVTALQEVESSRATDILELFGEATGLRPVAGPTLTTATGSSYGNALLVRGHLADVERVDLSVPHREPRGALDVTMEHGGEAVRVLATHLGLRPAERRQQVRRLLARIDERTRGPVALMGDLNEWFLWGRPLRWLHRVFEETPAPPTYPASFPLFALDRLWVKPRRCLEELAVHSSPLARVASDHLPLVARIEV